jgi:hypothetical protein
MRQTDLIRWEENIVFGIELKVSNNIKGEIVINVTLEGMQIALENGNPQN